jgi:predicted restriction endonuclease
LPVQEIRLLEAAYIVGDIEEAGEPVVSNGLGLCSIHHRAYDHDLVGVSLEVRQGTSSVGGRAWIAQAE